MRVVAVTPKSDDGDVYVERCRYNVLSMRTKSYDVTMH